MDKYYLYDTSKCEVIQDIARDELTMTEYNTLTNTSAYYAPREEADSPEIFVLNGAKYEAYNGSRPYHAIKRYEKAQIKAKLTKFLED